MQTKKTIIVIGGGAAGIMTALKLSAKFTVYLVEKEKTLGRKLLVAGKGGFNLTNNAAQDNLLSYYSTSGFLTDALNLFTASDLRFFLKELGIETFVGSSNRVFPIEGIKPIEVLNAFINKLNEKGVKLLLNHRLTDFSEDKVSLLSNKEIKTDISYDYAVLALGGNSWTKTGSDGSWLDLLKAKNVITRPFQASNCGVNIAWGKEFVKNHSGKPLKNIQLKINNFVVKGEALVTSYGLEGNAIYPIVKEVRECFSNGEEPFLSIDFKPKNTIETVYAKIKNSKPKEYASHLNLNSVEMALLKNYTSKEEFLDKIKFAQKVKELEVRIESLRPIDEAISTVGGVEVADLNKDFSLKKYSNIFTVGEMVDWDAPTGGFLLQGCFSMAVLTAQAINQKV